MLILRLAWRSFVRHRRRSMITGAAIAFGLAMMIFFVGLADDGHMRMANMGIRLGSGHVLVQGKGYEQSQSLDSVIANPAPIMAAARSIDGVEHVVQRVRTSGLLSSGEFSSAVAVSAVDPKAEPGASDIASADARVKGKYLRPRNQQRMQNAPADIYVGETLAKTLALRLDDRVVLTMSPRGSSRPTSAAFRVRGIFHTGISELDGFYVEIPLSEGQRLLGLGKAVTQVAVLIDQLDDADRVAASLRAKLADNPDVQVLTWKQGLRQLYEAILLDDLGMYLMMAIIFVIVAIGIFNTVLMSVVERTRELGVMMAIGTSAKRLFATVLVEALVLAVVSAVVGLALGLGIHLWVSSHGIDMAALYGEDVEMAGIILKGKIYSKLSAYVVTKWTVIVIGIVLVSAIYPAWRASRLKPVEAMRHV